MIPSETSRRIVRWPTRSCLPNWTSGPESVVERNAQDLRAPSTPGHSAAAFFEQPEASSTPAPQRGIDSMALAACVLGYGLLAKRERPRYSKCQSVGV